MYSKEEITLLLQEFSQQDVIACYIEKGKLYLLKHKGQICVNAIKEDKIALAIIGNVEKLINPIYQFYAAYIHISYVDERLTLDKDLWKNVVIERCKQE
jgi:hypothetical protein